MFFVFGEEVLTDVPLGVHKTLNGPFSRPLPEPRFDLDGKKYMRIDGVPHVLAKDGRGWLLCNLDEIPRVVAEWFDASA